MKDKEIFVGPWSKYIDGQGWTTEIPVEMLKEKGYIKIKDLKDKQICDCYHTKLEKRYIHHPITGEAMPYEKEVGVCWGTKECDQCDCGGDRKKCDFYEKVRNG